MHGIAGKSLRPRLASGVIRRRASTLIELLVVIALIGLLISILLPSLKRSMSLASATVCQYNLREVGHGIMMYRVENDGWLPVVDSAPVVSVDGGPADNAAWFVKLFPTYLQDPQILACPDDPYGHRMSAPREKLLRDPAAANYPSYGINSFILTYGDGMLSNIDRHKPTRPADTILVADLGPDEIHYGTRAVQANGPDRNSSLMMWGDGFDPIGSPARPWVTARHNHGINMLTFNGGVRDVRTADILRSPILRHYGNCSAGGCTMCNDLGWFHYSFAQHHLYWWTGPAPKE